MMNTSDERITGLSDEALDQAPAQEAAACIFFPPCYVSDEELAAR